MVQGGKIGLLTLLKRLVRNSQSALNRLRSKSYWRSTQPAGFRRRFEEAVANMSQGISLWDSEDRLQLVNEQFCRIYNMPAASLPVGMSFHAMLAQSVASGNYPGRDLDGVWQERKRFIDRREPGTFLQEVGDGRLITISHQPLKDGGWVATYEDITDRRRAEMQVRFLAQHDALTQLPNRLLFGERLEAALTASQAGRPCALICLDLDGFKLVNDRLGHAAGDVLLRQVADRLQAGLREGDTAARLGGDEFALLLGGAGMAHASSVVEQLGAELRREYQLDEYGPARINVSMGIACAPHHTTEPDTLLSLADKALYRAKYAGRIMSPAFGGLVSEGSKLQPADVSAGNDLAEPRDGLGALRAAGALVSDLRVALTAGDIHLEYQAIYNCDATTPVAYEALLRWVDPIRGTVSPAEFIPAAEDSGFIVTLSEWVLRQACSEAMEWLQPYRVSVNLSPLNFSQPNLVSVIAAILVETGLSPSRLVIEVTEGVLLDNSPAMQERIYGLRMLGIELWLDDFGTGYANFATLASSPFSSIKIDRTFLADGNRGHGILSAMITLGHTCGLKVIVEGVETMEQFDMLRSYGCDRVQGYLLGMPLPTASLNRSSDNPFHFE